MRTSMILPILLFATIPAASQQSPTSRAPSQYRFPADHMACPVELRVDRRASVISREVDGKAIPTGQGLALHFRSPSATTPGGVAVTPGRIITSADITVHGYAGRVIAQPLSADSQAELTESFHLTASRAEPLVDKTLWTARINGITWLELTRVTFADGTSWQSTIPAECRIEPSLFVLVK
jgi:hypothetical protein